MPVQTISKVCEELDTVDRFSLVAFIASCPVFLPCFDMLHGMLGELGFFTDIGFEAGRESSFLFTMPLAIMFTALAILLVCLLKTTFSWMGRRTIGASGGLYVVGYALLVYAAWNADSPLAMLDGAGVLIGVGLVVMALTWMTRLFFEDLRHACGAIVIALAISTFASMLLSLLAPAVGMSIAAALGAFGTVGALRGRRRRGSTKRSTIVAGSNWWDVFGKLDISLVKGAGEFSAPVSRILLFVIAPILVLLLFVVNRSISEGARMSALPLSTIGCLIAAACATPLLFMRNDTALVNTSYRMVLPVLAFLVLVADSLSPDGYQTMVLGIGIDIYCVLFVILIASMLLTMAGRMRSLAFPVLCMLLIAMSLTAVLSYSQIEAGVLSVLAPYVQMILFVAIVVVLIVTPSSQMWHDIITGVSREADAEPGVSYRHRCEQLAREHGLTQRESEILVYLGKGHSSAYVAEVLVVAESTVRSHRKNIYRKLGIGSREELLDMLDDAADDRAADNGRTEENPEK